MRVVQVLAIVAAGLGVSTPALAAGTFYVDTNHPNASNSNPGTEALPYKTITGASNSRKGPGTTIIVKPGVYREQVTIPASGAVGDPYIFRASGPGVIVDGSDDLSGGSNWALHLGTTYLAASVTWEPKQVFVDGVRLAPSTLSPDSLPVNSFRFVNGGQGGLFVNLGGSNPGDHVVYVDRRSHGFRASNRQYVTIEGFTVLRTLDRGIYALNGAAFTVIQGNTVTSAYRYGIAVNGTNNVTVDQNIVSDCQDHGIAMTDSSQNCLLRNNESSYNAHPTIRQANGIYLNRSMNNVIQGNRLHHNQDSGLQQNTNSFGNLALQNISWLNGDHGYDILNSTNVTLVGCVAYKNYKDGFSIEGASSGAKVHNCIGVDNGINVLPADGTLEPNLWVDNASSVGFQSDYNIWWNSTSVMPIKYILTWYPTIAGFTAATGHDSHSLQVNPQWVDPMNGNFELQSTSPAIDAGHSAVTAWPPLDALGRPRKDDPSVTNTGVGPITYADRGALEYQADQLPFVSAPTSVSADEDHLVSFQVHAADPDGTGISSLVATGLPAGATFTPAAGDTVGTFTWLPGLDQAGLYTVTFTASNTLTASAATNILITNLNQAPVVTAPAAVTVNEGELLTFDVTVEDADTDSIASLVATNLPAGATFTPATDNHSGTFSWTPGFEDAGGPFTVWFIASNSLNGAASTAITVADSDRAPEVAAPTSVSANEGEVVTFDVHAADPDGQGLTSLVATDLPPGASFTPAPGDSVGTFSWAPGFSDAGPHTVTFTASNTTSGSASTAITIGNVDRAPVVSAPTETSATEGQLVTFDVFASDPDGEGFTSLEATNLPEGATFTPQPGNGSGTFSWTPSLAQAGPYSVLFTASNALSGSASTSITVANADQAPVVAAPANVSANEGELVTFDVHAADPDGQGLTSLIATDLPPGASFTPAPGDTVGTFSWAPSYIDAGPYTVTFTASNELSGSASTTITIGNMDRAPVVGAPAVVSAVEGQLVTFEVFASDPDAEAILSLEGTNLPPGATFTPAAGNGSGTFSWTPTLDQADTFTVIFTASNALASAAFTTIDVANADQAPILAAPASVSANEGELVTFDVHAVDPDGEGIFSLTAADLPPGASFTPAPGDTVGTFSWAPSYTDAGPYTVTFTASNALSGSAGTTITIGNVDRAPVVSAPTETSATEGQLVTFDVFASDPDGEGLTSLEATNLPEGATFTPQPGNGSGTFSWTPSLAQSGPHTVTFTATNTLTGSASTVISVANTDQAPVVAAPSLVQASEGQLVTFDVHAADPDGDGLTSLTATDLPPGASFTPAPGDSVGTFSWTPGFGQSGDFTVTFTASNTLSAPATTTVHVGDVDQAPVVTVQPSMSVSDGQLLSFQVLASDADGDSILSLVATDLPEGATFTPNEDHSQGIFSWTPSLAQTGQFTVTFTATNALTGSASVTITVNAVTGVDPIATIPTRPVLSPNPVRSRSTLSFYLPSSGPLEVGLHDLAGRLVRQVAHEREASAGVHHLAIDGRSDSGEQLASGVYFFSIRTAQGTRTGRVVIAR